MIEICWNEYEGIWWFELGISISKTEYHIKPYVLAIGIMVFTIYIRW